MFNNRNMIIAGGLTAVILIWIIFARGGNKEPMAEITKGENRVPVTELYQQAAKHKEDRNLPEAKTLLKKIINEYPDVESIDKIQKELENLNMEILLSNTPTEDTLIHEVVSGDTLGELAKKYATTVEFIKQSNNLNSNVIRVGQKLRIWTAPFNIFVDKSQNILMLKQDDEVLKVYSVSTGENNSTPVGTFKITSKLIDPVWFNKGVVVPPESPANVLGSRWLGFDLPGYGIHGTTEPENIGKQVTAGCVRMRNGDVEELYSIIPLTTEVVVVD